MTPFEAALDVVTKMTRQLVTERDELLAALVAIEAALRKDSRQKDIIGDDVEYHLDGQTMGYAINLARAAIAKVEGRS